MPSRALPSALALLALAAPARGQTASDRPFELALEGVSRYVFSGLTFSDRPVVHPSLSATFGGFRLTGLGTWYTDEGELLEADVFLEYAAEAGSVGLYGAVSRYHFELENGWEGTTEVLVGASWDGPLQPSLTLTEDFDIGDGGLVEASIGHAFPIGSRWLEASLALTHNRHYYSDLTGLSHLEAAFEVELPLGPRLRLSPRLAGVLSLRDDVGSAIYGGVRLGFAF